MKKLLFILFAFISFAAYSQNGAITALNGVILGDNAGTIDGTIRYNGVDFEGRTGGLWKALSSVWSTNGTTAYYDGGTVAIGKDNTVGTFDIFATTAPKIRLQHNNSGSSVTDGIYMGIGGNESFYLWHYEPGESLFFGTEGGTDMTLDNQGFLGIGTSAPMGPLHVVGGDSYMEDELYVGGTTFVSNIWTVAHLQNTNTGVGSGLYIQAADSGFGALNGAQISLEDGANPDISIFNRENGGIAFRAGGAFSPHMLIDNGGNVSIGTVTNATGYKLSVDGKIICEELRVELSGSWPDYVFANDYNLMSLNELEAFIQTNHHLPNIPAAAEMEESGIAVGEMQEKMMEKIEELTLYILQQQKEIDALKKEVKELRD